MQWLGKQIREGMNARTYVLVGTLLVALFWIWSLDQKSRAIRDQAVAAPAVARAAAPPAAAAAPASERAWPTTPTPPGWGDDPFERRFR